MVLGRKTNFYLDKTPKKKHVFVQSVCKVSQKIVFFLVFPRPPEHCFLVFS